MERYNIDDKLKEPPVITTFLTGEDLEEQAFQAVENEINSILRLLNVRGEIHEIRRTDP